MGTEDLHGYTTSNFGNKRLGGSEDIFWTKPRQTEGVCGDGGRGGGFNNYTTGSKTATGLINQHMHGHHWLLLH